MAITCLFLFFFGVISSVAVMVYAAAGETAVALPTLVKMIKWVLCGDICDLILVRQSQK